MIITINIVLATTCFSNNQGIDNKILSLATKSYNSAIKQGYGSKEHLLTIVNYELPSNSPRLWVLSPKTKKILFKSYVTHGRGSGLTESTSFSNSPRSNKSSLGMFVTGDSYNGKHGQSMRLHGLEKGINDKAFSRSIVIHGAKYATDKFIEQHKRMGRSLGCLALSPENNKKLIKLLQKGSFVFSYYPDKNWLKSSNFLKK